MIDYKLVEFVSSLPIEMKYKPNHPKYLLKEVLIDIVPDYILNAPKKGFTPPLEFLNEMINTYQYQCIESDHVFFNSMLADRLLEQMLKS